MGEGTPRPVGRWGRGKQVVQLGEVCPLCPGVGHSSSTPREVFCFI